MAARVLVHPLFARRKCLRVERVSRALAGASADHAKSASRGEGPRGEWQPSDEIKARTISIGFIRSLVVGTCSNAMKGGGLVVAGGGALSGGEKSTGRKGGGNMGGKRRVAPGRAHGSWPRTRPSCRRYGLIRNR